ncbi:MAG: hypothetical protein M3T55_07170 [Pseudomonadota bacterium]|nr:hypothetical protein [Pseudomonadota bacterium]
MSDEARSAATAELEHIRALVATNDNLIISSEMFQQANPDLVAAVFPPEKTRVIVYIREQLDYMISAYTQRIQTTVDRQPFVNFAIKFDPDYLYFLDAWARAFGSDNFDVRIYDRSCLEGNDIRMDFLSAIGLDPKLFDFGAGGKQQGNPTIGPELVEFKGALNALAPEPVHREFLIFDLLAELAPRFPRLQTSSRFAVLFRDRFRASNRAVRQRYLGSKLFPKHQIEGPPTRVNRDEAIDTSLRALREIAPRAYDGLANYLEKAEVAKLELMLPDDWPSAEAELE